MSNAPDQTVNIEKSLRQWINRMIKKHPDLNEIKLYSAIRSISGSKIPRGAISKVGVLRDKGMSCKAIAQELGISLSSVYAAWSKVRRKRGIPAHPEHVEQAARNRAIIAAQRAASSDEPATSAKGNA